MVFPNAIIPLITAPISFLSSITIIIMIMRSRYKLSHMYHRIMVGFSTADIILSGAMSLTSFAAPKESDSWSAIGSQATCNTQGFFFMLGGSAAPLYFLSLQIYYLCVIKYEMNFEDLRNIEPFLHGVPILFSFVSAIIPLVTDHFNPGTSWCWIQALPMGCPTDLDTACTRGKHAGIQRWLFIGGPIVVSLIVSFIVMWMIYSSVRKQDQLNASHDFRSSSEDNPLSNSSSILSLVKGAFVPAAPRISARYRKSQQARQRISQYYMAYMLTTIVPVTQVTIAMAIGHPVNILEILQYIFYPLQGLYNIIVFILPDMKRVRTVHKDMPFPLVFITAIKAYTGPNPNIKSPNQRNRATVRLSIDVDGGLIKDEAENLEDEAENQLCKDSCKDDGVLGDGVVVSC